jgi:hypothetical protein
MKNVIIGAVLALAALASPVVYASPWVDVELGTVYDPTGTISKCTVTDQLPQGLRQVDGAGPHGVVTFHPNSRTRLRGATKVEYCGTYTYNVSAFGEFFATAQVGMSDGLSDRPINVRINVTGTYDFGTWPGAVFPKYQVLGIDYAPPGSQSSVSYSASFSRGGSTSVSKSFNAEHSVTVATTGSFNIGPLGVDLSTSISGLYSQRTDNTTGNSWSITTTGGDIIRGPASSSVGIDHNYDVIWVWLNPAVNLTLNGPASISWDGYAFNPANPANEMDVIPLYVHELKDPSLLPANVAARLARTWDRVLGGLTTDDYAEILKSHPFANNPAYDPNTDTTGRFIPMTGQTFNYVPAIAGAQPVTQEFTSTAQVGSNTANGSQVTRSVSMTVGGTANFVSKLKVELKNTETWTSTTTRTTSDSAGETAKLFITGPQASDNYTGPTALQIWRDTIYGSYMFFAVH